MQIQFSDFNALRELDRPCQKDVANRGPGVTVFVNPCFAQPVTRAASPEAIVANTSDRSRLKKKRLPKEASA
jgi:hypothetical protein